MKYTVFPDSVRLDPINIRLFEYQPKLYSKTIPADYLYKNPVWNGETVKIKSAGNEYVSFQIALMVEKEYEKIEVSMTPLTGETVIPERCIEIFREWFVEVQVPSSGYEKTTLGRGWYPDALIPVFPNGIRGGFTPPFYIPDYTNRVPNQKAAVLWVDIYTPPNQAHGVYKSTISIKSPTDSTTIEIPVELSVWPFTLPNEDNLKGNLFTGAFKKWSHEKELRYQHVLKKHRIAVHQCYYRPELKIENDEPVLDWTQYDQRISKYLDGSAFTEKHGYYGTGYGEPMEYLLLPFNCSGKKGQIGWPMDTRRDSEENFWKIWDKTAKEVRKHLIDEKRVNLKKTQLQIFFNALDECYKREDHERMIAWSVFMKKHFPEAVFRIDGGYNDETMDMLIPHVDLCIYHTIAYNRPSVEKYRNKGLIDWIYGPMVYESNTNGLTGASTFIDLDNLTMRGQAWICWKYNAATWCQWEFMCGSKQAWYNPENFKNHSLEEFRCFNGNGMLLYDGEVMDLPDPCVSIRFKAGRSGSQEFEYLKLLKDLGGNPESIVNSVVYEPLGRKSVGNIEPWNTNIAAWDEARLKLGEEIAKRV
ncbi:MAG: DUF4091 domain-containing protein [Fibrobacteres bacterium]|nr:DUF4091 domain-containing protein [Fibrobacterota bacterium]